MGNYFADYNAVDTKLVELLDENLLVRSFDTQVYPITLTISQNASPASQAALVEASNERGLSSQDASLVISFPVGGIGIRVSGRLCISDALLNKIKGYAKKLHYLYLQAEYAARSAVVPKDYIQKEEPEEVFGAFFDGEPDE